MKITSPRCLGNHLNRSQAGSHQIHKSRTMFWWEEASIKYQMNEERSLDTFMVSGSGDWARPRPCGLSWSKRSCKYLDKSGTFRDDRWQIIQHLGCGGGPCDAWKKLPWIPRAEEIFSGVHREVAVLPEKVAETWETVVLRGITGTERPQNLFPGFVCPSFEIGGYVFIIEPALSDDVNRWLAHDMKIVRTVLEKAT